MKKTIWIRLFDLVTFLVILFCFQNLSANEDWVLKKNQNNIKIYTRSSDQSSFAEFKGVTTLQKCELNKVLELLLDVDNYEAWFPDCMNSKILELKSAYHNIHYSETKSPWPAQDRCGVYEQKTVLSEDGKRAEMVFIALPDYPVEVKKMVRITEAVGKWILEESNDELKITYQFNGNPGGDIPSWLANTFVVKHPFETLESLTKRMVVE